MERKSFKMKRIFGNSVMCKSGLLGGLLLAMLLGQATGYSNEGPRSFYVTYQQTISGVVRDVSNIPIPGVTVLEKGTTNGVVTDIDGRFSMEASSGSTLVFSCFPYCSCV